VIGAERFGTRSPVNTTPRIAPSACSCLWVDFERKNVIGKRRTGGGLALLKMEEFRHSLRRCPVDEMDHI